MKIGFLITARLKSSRLPLKILKDLNGRTVTERIIDRCKEVHGVSQIVLCTSPNPRDKALAEVAEKNRISCFLGDEDDVLKRLLDASILHELDYFIGITADNPLFSIYYSNLIADTINTEGHDFIKVQGLPLGAATYGMNVKALATVCEIKTIVDTEIWGYLIDRPEVFDIKTIQAKAALNRHGLRFTLDYEEDYEFLNNIYTNVPFEKVIKLDDVMDYLNKNPEVVRINEKCVQRDLDQETKDKINALYLERTDEVREIKTRIYKR